MVSLVTFCASEMESSSWFSYVIVSLPQINAFFCLLVEINIKDRK